MGCCARCGLRHPHLQRVGHVYFIRHPAHWDNGRFFGVFVTVPLTGLIFYGASFVGLTVLIVLYRFVRGLFRPSG